MSDDKIFVFAVSNHDARYSNIVKIDEKNGNYYLSVLIAESSCLTYSATIGQNDVQELYDIVKPVNEWSSKDSEKREILDTNWFIYFNNGENAIRANGYKDFPDDYDAVVNKISNWLIAVLKKDNIEFDDFSQDDFKNALANKPHYIFSYYYYLPLSSICEYITIEEKNNIYFVNSSFDSEECTKRKVEISKENIDKILEILEPLIKCDNLNDSLIVFDVCCELKISYNGIKFSAKDFNKESIDFSGMMLHIKKIISEIC